MHRWLSLLLLKQLLRTTLSTTAETTLIAEKLANYDRNIRPTLQNEATIVTSQFSYFILLLMDQQEEFIRFGADIRLSWRDPILTWTPSEQNGNTQKLLLKETQIWRPDIAVVNSLSQTMIINEDDRLAEVLSDGSVFTTNPSVYDTWCSLNMNNFPFDTQYCSVNVGSWVYTANETTIVTNESSINVMESPDFTGNSEWDITEMKASIKTTVDGGEFYQEVRYNIKLERRAAYYIFVLLMPTFIVTTLCILGLFTPLDNLGNRAERATLGLTTLLSLSVILNLVGKDMPKQSSLPRLALYVLAEIVVCSVGVLITIIMQMAHQRVNTRLLLPPSTKLRDRLPHSAPDKLGMRTLVSSDGKRRPAVVDEIEESLRQINQYIERTSWREELLLYWVKVFDRLDLIFLIILQLANIILTIIVLTINFPGGSSTELD